MKFVTISITLDLVLEIADIKVDIPIYSFYSTGNYSNYIIQYEHFKHRKITKYSEIKEIINQLSNRLESLVFDCSFYSCEIVIQSESFLLTILLLI